MSCLSHEYPFYFEAGWSGRSPVQLGQNVGDGHGVLERAADSQNIESV